MTSAAGIPGLVLSRARYDVGRHVAAMLAVAILLASVVVFHAIAAGLAAGVAALVQEERPHELQYTQKGLFSSAAPVSEAELEAIRAWPGVVEATGRRVADSGAVRENTTGTIMVAGVDFLAERDQVTQVAPPPEADPNFRTISFGARLADVYGLFDGRWPATDAEAVITDSLRGPGWMRGDQITVETPSGPRELTIVGIILDEHPAGHGVPGMATAGHVLVADHLMEGAGFRSIRVTTETEYEAVRAVADRLRALWPESWRENKAAVEGFEERHYEATRAQAVLSAAARFVLLSGAATIFAMSLMLLNGERRGLAVFLALGLGGRRVARYVALKMGLLIVGGILVGLAIGHGLLAYVPLPDLGYELVPRATGAATRGAVASTVVAALVGAGLATFTALREPAASGLRLHE